MLKIVKTAAFFHIIIQSSQCSGPDVILSFCEFPVSSSLSCLDAAVSLMSPSVDACIQGNESLVLLYSFIKL